MHRRVLGFTLVLFTLAAAGRAGEAPTDRAPASPEAVDPGAHALRTSDASNRSEPTPAQRAIAQAERDIAAQPDHPRGHVALAMSLARRGRETADPDLYAAGHRAVQRAYELAPDHLEAARAEAWLLLGQHRFEAALEIAERVHKRFPDDILTYGLIADAAVELGDYERAEEMVQWMLDLRPGSVPGLTRGAYLRELFGDHAGALEWMREALSRVRPRETEDRAWILTHMAHLERLRGNLEVAGRLAEGALDLFDGYHYALAQLAKVREAEGAYTEAVELWSRHYEVAPHPENLFYLAKAQHALGESVDARAKMEEFERAALEESEAEDNANRDLVLYYVDYANRPVAALELAQREVERRRDVLTLDAYAWALAANGRLAEARAALDEALAVGVRDPEILAHEAAIAALEAEGVSADAPSIRADGAVVSEG